MIAARRRYSLDGEPVDLAQAVARYPGELGLDEIDQVLALGIGERVVFGSGGGALHALRREPDGRPIAPFAGQTVRHRGRLARVLAVRWSACYGHVLELRYLGGSQDLGTAAEGDVEILDGTEAA